MERRDNAAANAQRPEWHVVAIDWGLTNPILLLTNGRTKIPSRSLADIRPDDLDSLTDTPTGADGQVLSNTPTILIE